MDVLVAAMGYTTRARYFGVAIRYQLWWVPPISFIKKSADSARCCAGTCTLLIRMGKDFGNNVLPLGKHEYMKLAGDDPKSLSTWRDILQMNSRMLSDVMQHGLPLWSYGFGHGGRFAMILYLPKSSAMSRRWAADMRNQWTPLGDILWASNTTMLLAKGTSPVPVEISIS